MTQSCTIYCQKADIQRIDAQVQQRFPDVEESISTAAIIVHGVRGQLQITAMRFEKQADKFSRLRNSTAVHAESMTVLDARKKHELVKNIEATELIVGVVGEPEFDADERFHDLIFALAQSLDGIIFDGIDFIDANGESVQ